MKIRIILALVVFMMLAACGKKGALMPPEALVPAAVESLQVLQKGDDFQLSWTPPSREEGGRPLKDLAGFRLLRRQVLPKEIDCSSCPDSWQLLNSVELDFPVGVKRSGNYFIYLDSEVKPEARVQYRLLAFSKNGGISRPVTTDLRKKVAPPLPPSLQAKMLPTSILLTIEHQPGSVGADAGFNIYRRQPGEQPSLLPVNPVPIVSKEWEDKMPRYGKTYLYQATAVSTRSGQQVESSFSNEAGVLFTLSPLE